MCRICIKVSSIVVFSCVSSLTFVLFHCEKEENTLIKEPTSHSTGEEIPHLKLKIEFMFQIKDGLSRHVRPLYLTALLDILLDMVN